MDQMVFSIYRISYMMREPRKCQRCRKEQAIGDYLTRSWNMRRLCETCARKSGYGGDIDRQREWAARKE